MNASAPFEKAVKHLFRHLHDARALTRNPLVRRIFDNSPIVGNGQDRNPAVLVQIHQLVRQGAERCLEADLRSGKRQRGLRRYAIITQQCLEQRPIRDVAAELGISYHHCYRERAAICRRVARFICSDEVAVLDYFSELDEFRSLVDRTEREVMYADIEAASRKYNALIRAASSNGQKIEATCLKALNFLLFGSIERADSTLSEAQGLFAEYSDGNSPDGADLSQVWIDLTASKFAQYQGDEHEAVKSGQRAIVVLEPLQSIASVHLTELYLHSLYEVGTALWNLGDRERAHDYIVRAEERAGQMPAVDFGLRLQVVVTLWKQRCRLLMSSRAWYPAWQRLSGLTTAFEGAYAAGSLVQAMDALGVVAECNALAGRGDEALRAAGLAVSLAKKYPNERIKAQVPIDVAAKLMPTEFWEEALGLFSEVKQLNRCEAFYRANASYLVAARALRLQCFQEAWRLANLSNDYTGYADLMLRKRLTAAAAAGALGWQSQAHDILEELIPEAEALGSAAILRDAYNVAAKVTGNASRFRRKARELSQLLAR
jgi:hypothetical protein